MLLLISFIYDYCTIYIPVLIYILDILILLHFFMNEISLRTKHQKYNMQLELQTNRNKVKD